MTLYQNPNTDRHTDRQMNKQTDNTKSRVAFVTEKFGQNPLKLNIKKTVLTFDFWQRVCLGSCSVRRQSISTILFLDCPLIEQDPRHTLYLPVMGRQTFTERCWW